MAEFSDSYPPARIISRIVKVQSRPIQPLPGKVHIRRARALREAGCAEGTVAVLRDDRAAGIRQLPHTAQRVGQVVGKAARLLFANAGWAVEVGVRADGENLGRLPQGAALHKHKVAPQSVTLHRMLGSSRQYLKNSPIKSFL